MKSDHPDHSPGLTAVGVGPGDPELLTLKAVRALRQADVILAPKAEAGGDSIAGGIVGEFLDLSRQELIEQVYPMRLDQQGLTDYWLAAADEVARLVRSGKRVAFVTLGDPMLYSTFLYLQQHLHKIAPEIPVDIVSGLSSIHAAAALAGIPLGIADERLAVLPATFEDDRLRQALLDFDTVALMKVGRVFERLRELLAELGLKDRAVYVRQVGLAGQRVFTDLDQVGEQDRHYLSMILVRKPAGRREAP